MKKILNNHKIQMDVINDILDSREQNVARFENIPKDLFNKADFERKQDLEDRATELEVEATLEGEHPECHGDSPGINMIGDQL